MKWTSLLTGLILVLFMSLSEALCFSTSGMDGPARSSGQRRSGISTSGMGMSSGKNGTQYAKLSPSQLESEREKAVEVIRRRIERMPEEPRKPDKKTVARPAPAAKPSKLDNPYIGTVKDGYLRFYESQVPEFLDRLHGMEKWRPLTRTIAKVKGIDPKLFHVIGAFESGGGTKRGKKGEHSLYQLMPRTARMMGVKNPEDPAQNVRGGADYLLLLYRNLGSWENAILGYNLGEGGAREFLKKRKATDHPYVRQIYAMYELHG